MNAVRLLVADPLPVVRSGVRALLHLTREFEVVEAGDLDGVLDAAAEACPGLALIDVGLRPTGGIAAVSFLRDRCETRSIVWSLDPSPADVLSAIRAGAVGYLRKDVSPDGLVRSLQGALHGQAPLARDLTAGMIEELHGHERRVHAHDRAATLSRRERDVLELMATGSRNREIAVALAISEFTVKRHVQNILGKLGLRSRRAAAALYVEAFADGAALRGVA